MASIKLKKTHTHVDEVEPGDIPGPGLVNDLSKQRGVSGGGVHVLL